MPTENLLKTSLRGTQAGELGRMARHPGEDPPTRETELSRDRDTPVLPPPNIPQVLRTGCNPTTRRPKGQNFRVEQGVPVERPPAVVAQGSEESALQNLTDIHTSVDKIQKEASAKFEPPKEGAWESLPAHVRNAGLTLTFYAYFRETVPESPLEKSRIRPINFIYKMEDGTISLFEPHQGNSGMPQGKYLYKHKIPKSKEFQDGDLKASNPNAALQLSRKSSRLDWTDFRIGEDIKIYGKTYHIYGCDTATRRFFERTSEAPEQPPDEDPPGDKYTAERTQFMLRESGMDSSTYRGKRTSPVKRYMEAQRGNPSATQTRGTADKYQQFLDHDRDVLRFSGYWDDRDRVYGDQHLYTISYYLMDDEIEVLEVHEPNDGKDRFPALYRKGPLPKKTMVVDSRARDIEDDCGEDDYYHWTDLQVGKTVNILGRNILLFDADKFTVNWYKEQLGIDMTEEINKLKGKVMDEIYPKEETPVIQPPPYENFGFGTEEDSLGSFFSLIPKVPRRDVVKLTKGEGQILRYYAVLDSDDPISKLRRFIVAYYPATSELAVFEKPLRNSGMDSGKFLSKRKLRNPNTGDFFRLEDFYIGAKLDITSHRFHLYDADSLTKRLAKDADGRNGIGMGSLELALQSTREQLQQQRITRTAAERRLRPHRKKMLSYPEFETLMRDWKIELSGEDMTTLFRAYDHAGTGKLSTDDFLDALLPQRQLTKEKNGKKYPCSINTYEELLNDHVVSNPVLSRLEKLHDEMTNDMIRRIEKCFKESNTELISRKQFRQGLRKAVNYDDVEVDALEDGYMPPGIDCVPPEFFLDVIQTRCPNLY
eukprot:gb/GECG01016718.1/.p1 GENE.gb/GECG01016718.1/~~gb/GECG01016718.1/.p1  ORF type:complete len:823 (+),score=122.84 gb/GECG01016718.1/:1-2469(+)